MRDRTIYKFGDFRLLPYEGILLHNGRPIPLPLKAFSTLVLLVEDHGHLVKNSELIEKVWANTFVEKAAVSRCIWTIRHALREDPKSQRFIQTLPKLGYRFVAEVSVVNEAPPSAVRSGISALAAIALISIALAGASAIYLRKPTLENGSEPRIAVLPFRALSENVDDTRYELGIADAVILKLNSSKGLAVQPLQAVQAYAGQEQDAIEAGKKQKVDYVLSSNYQIAEGKIRVTSRLFNIAGGQVADTFTVEKVLTDFFSVQDAVADDLSNSLLTRFTVNRAAVPKKRGTSNEDAYRNYLQGMYLYAKRSPANSAKALELFQKAVELDPNYAAAWAGKAHAHRYAANLSRDTDTHSEYRKSMDAINRALSLDKDLSEAHSALCENKYYYEFDFNGADVACRRAIALDPHSSLAHEIYGRFLYHRGRFDEGIAEMKMAIDLDPASLFNQRNLGIAYYYGERYEEAEIHLKRVIEMDQSFGSAYMWLRSALEMQQKYAEAFEWFIKGQEAIYTEEKIIRFYKNAYATSGYEGLIREHAKFADTYNQYYIGAILNAQVGNQDRAFEYLQISYQRREWGMNSLLIEPKLEPLRSDSRFEELVEKIGLN